MLENKTPLHPDVQDIRGRIADFEQQIDIHAAIHRRISTNNPAAADQLPPLWLKHRL